MRLSFILLFFFIAFGCIAQSKIDVIHYKFELELSDQSDTIYGKAEIKVKLLQPVSFFPLDLVLQNSKGKGMKVDNISGPDVSNFENYSDSLRIVLGTTRIPGDTITFTVNYHGIPNDGLVISKNKYGHRTFFADNWPDRAHNWIPCIDDPADKASFEFIVTAPGHYQVISNGIQTEETNLPGNKKLTHWAEEIPLPTKVMVIGVAEFAVLHEGFVNCVPVSSWVFPENKSEGFKDYARAKDILAFLSDYIGPYPYKKLANVQSKTIFGGMENASAIFYFENSVTGKDLDESLLAHEIVHQWFGDMATEKSFAHLWLSEGFATYLTHIYMESKYGTDSLNRIMQNDREEIIDFVKKSDKPVIDSISPFMQLLNVNNYQKGGWVLHMLRRQLGDSVFHRIIRTYYDAYKGRNADTKDLQTIAENVSGKNLNTFFRQWLYTPGIPQMNITWKYNTKEKNIAITINQLQKKGVFRFPLDIFIQEKLSTPKLMTWMVSKNSETFTFPVKSKPVKVKVDPYTSLLFEGTVTEIK